MPESGKLGIYAQITGKITAQITTIGAQVRTVNCSCTVSFMGRCTAYGVSCNCETMQLKPTGGYFAICVI